MYFAADAGQSTTYLPLIIAAVGILGTLAASVLTQWMNSRRDTKQWVRQKQLQDERFEREREQEALRWERERGERREQWQREDTARLHQERLSAYQTLLASFDTAIKDLKRLAMNAHWGILDVEDQFDKAFAAESILEEPVARVEIIGSPTIVSATKDCVTTLNQYARMIVWISPEPDAESEKKSKGHQETLALLRSQLVSLRNEIRSDIGSEIKSAKRPI
ncbi:hypothetical protein AB0M02_13415 [Actinoplanes sp. NPDC051861]|uniref:hypothetical protein n=1 Tax=Actinoplanes sp. NPDC051861 TaxID=3155170 RepID=UPI0034378B55